MKTPAVISHVARVQRVAEKVRRPKASVREVGPHRLCDFVPWLSPDLLAPRWLEPLTSELDRVTEARRAGKPPPKLELCVSVPPRHAKSTTVHHWIVQLLLQDPTRRILYASYDGDFAAYNVRQIRRLMMVAGLAIGSVDKAAEIELVEGGAIVACGIQSPPTGLGFDLIVVDDPIRKLADALSTTIRNNIGDGFDANLYSRKTPGKNTAFVIVATRWHEDDLTGRLAQKGWRVINLPAVLPSGEALAPEIWPLEELEKFRRQNQFTWDALYMGDPTPRGGRMFGDPFWVEELPAGGKRAMGVDLAHTAKRRSDRHALLVMLDPMERDGALYVADFLARRGPLTDVVDPVRGRVMEEGFVRELAARPYRAAMYTGKDEDLVLDMLGKLDGVRAHVEARRAISDKRARAQPVATAWNQGRIRIPRNAPWAEDFVARVLAFTGNEGDKDEEVDVLATAFDMLAEGESRVHQPATSTKHLRLGIGIRKRWT